MPSNNEKGQMKTTIYEVLRHKHGQVYLHSRHLTEQEASDHAAQSLRDLSIRFPNTEYRFEIDLYEVDEEEASILMADIGSPPFPPGYFKKV